MLKAIFLFLLNAQVYANDPESLNYQQSVEQFQLKLQQEQERQYKQQILNNQRYQILLQVEENERQQRLEREHNQFGIFHE